MGYQVEYPQIRKVDRMEKSAIRLPVFTALCVLLFFAIVNSMWPRGSEVLRGMVFSGDIAVTTAALETLSIDLRAGEPLQDALQTFCRSVLSESTIASD